MLILTTVWICKNKKFNFENYTADVCRFIVWSTKWLTVVETVYTGTLVESTCRFKITQARQRKNKACRVETKIVDQDKFCQGFTYSGSTSDTAVGHLSKKIYIKDISLPNARKNALSLYTLRNFYHQNTFSRLKWHGLRRDLTNVVAAD